MLAAIDWTLHWGGWSIAAVAVMALVAVGLAILSAAQLQSRLKASVLVGARILSVVLVMLALMQPSWVTVVPIEGTRSVAVVVDTSQSMAIGDKESRQMQAGRHAATLAARQPSRLFTFDTTLRPSTLAALPNLAATGRTTRLQPAIEALSDIIATGDVGAVVLLSDGADHSHSTATADEEHLSTALRSALYALGVPVHTLLVGDDKLRDVAVAEIEVSPFAFVRSQLPVVIKITANGTRTGDTTTLDVLLNGAVVHRSQVKLDSDGTHKVEVDLQPVALGDAVITARVVALPGEATATNNIKHKRVRVLRDRVRVLHLAGHPSWDTRFLRSHLRSDPAVDLVSFYIMVAQGSGFFVRARDTTLIEFPTKQLFEEALTDFDLVIFHDFRFSRFDVEAYLPLLHRYVRSGGAFLVIGGTQALTAGGYDRTTLSNWLPVTMRPPLAGASLYEGAEVGTRLSNAGKHHPVTALRDDINTNMELWRKRVFLGRNRGLGVRDGGEALVLAPDGSPLLAVSQHDKGRVGVLATGGLWSWAFGADPTNRAQLRDDYHALLNRLRGWLTRAPEYDQLSVRALATPVVGSHMTLVARASKRGGAPAAETQLMWRARPTDEPDVAWIKAAATNKHGVVHLDWVPVRGGVHIVEVRAAGPGGGRAQTVVGVESATDELRDVRPRPDHLQAISEATGGQFWRKPPSGPIPQAARSATQNVRRSRRELWSHPFGGIVLVLLLASEWAMRRRWGLA